MKPYLYSDGELPALMASAHDVVKDPNSEAPKKRLAKNVADMRAAVKAVIDAIKNAPPVSTESPQVKCQ